MARPAVAVLLLLGLATSMAAELDCPVKAAGQGIVVAGGFSDLADANGLQEAAKDTWKVLLANPNATAAITAATTGCDLATAVLKPTGGCSQVVAGTNTRVHFDVSFPGCPAKLAIKAEVFTPLPGQGSPSVTAFEVTKAPTMVVIPVWAQCGGAGGDCSARAEEMKLPVADVCGNKDWPMTMCAEGSDCKIWSRWYRQCTPTASSVHCPVVDPAKPAMVGGYSPSTNTTDQQPIDNAVWANLVATNATGLPADSGCDISRAVIEPISGCSQVVAGMNWIVSFKVSFPGSCPLFTTVDANVFAALPANGGGVEVKATRVAPYDSADEYCQSAVSPSGQSDCQKILVFQQWQQCGGTGPAAASAAARMGMDPAMYGGDREFPYSQCAYGTKCVRGSADYWQCQ